MARGPSVRRLAAQDLTSALGVGWGDLAAVVGAAGDEHSDLTKCVSCCQAEVGASCNWRSMNDAGMAAVGRAAKG